MGWDWVRRPTGGRAILHTDELTYSILAPALNPRMSGGVLESYQRLSSALLAALNTLNIPALSNPNKSSPKNPVIDPVCFEVPSNYEITVSGMKLVGSAQARRKNVVLQHGTFPLCGDLARITQVLAFPDENSRTESQQRLLSHATTAERVLSKKISWQEAADAFILGFQTELNLEFMHASLSEIEIMQTEQLIQGKYTHPSWLERI
jgi:lipoate-protein ligase A